MTPQLSALDDLFGGDTAADPDPSRVDHDRRRATRIAPAHVDTTALSRPFAECGCGDCPERVDPLSGNSLQTDPDLQVYAVEECPRPRPVTVEKGRRAYIRYARSNMQRDVIENDKYHRDRRVYAEILDTDRILRERYTGLTTAMVTRRLSPLDDRGEWLSPWTLDEMLHGGRVGVSVRNAIDYQLQGYQYEYVRVTAVTEPAATPHEHIYLWIDDPSDAVEKHWFDSAIRSHVEKCENAEKSHHKAREDGSGGAITVQQPPDLITEPPDKFGSVLAHSDSGDVTHVPRNTRGAVYVASQLPHLHIGDLAANQRENPPDTFLEGGAFKWAVPHKWYRSSAGVGTTALL